MSFYAGFDCSTQGLSVVVLDAARRRIVFRDSLAFDEPFLASGDGRIVHASPPTWGRALETMLGRVAAQVDRRSLRAISGAAQQHGSVYCGETPETLTRGTSPIWMDSSAARECREIEAALGGPAATANLAGSRGFPRFTAPQIRKFACEQPEAYARTRRIHLVSSYMASLLVGAHAPIDHADASGMMLMDIGSRAWSRAALDATAPQLESKLPALVPSSTVVGTLARKWQERFGLPPAGIIAWSGDNPCSLVGTGLIHEGQLALSLGTSDTIFGPMREPRVSADGIGHLFASPLGEYMGITVFRNGSLARQRVRDAFGMSWEAFSESLQETPPGNGGATMLPWFEPEITPEVPTARVHRFGLERAAPAQHVRAIVEAQIMALARHSTWMGLSPDVIHATGGAAANRGILQVIADVFATPVHRFEATDSAALGAALRALQADTGREWDDVLEGFVTPVAEAIRPVATSIEVYRGLRALQAAREATALGT